MAIVSSATDNAHKGRDLVRAGEESGQDARRIKAIDRVVRGRVLVPARGNICQFAPAGVMTGRHSLTAVKQNAQAIALLAVVSVGKITELKERSSWAAFFKPQFVLTVAC